jgi:putative transposase
METVKQMCKEIEDRFFVLFETIGFDEDHVHFLVEGLSTTYSPAKIFQFVKSIIAIELFKRHQEIKKQLYHGEFWSDGGYVGTVGEGINGDIIRNYIKSQGRNGEQLKLINFS